VYAGLDCAGRGHVPRVELWLGCDIWLAVVVVVERGGVVVGAAVMVVAVWVWEGVGVGGGGGVVAVSAGVTVSRSKLRPGRFGSSEVPGGVESVSLGGGGRVGGVACRAVCAGGAH